MHRAPLAVLVAGLITTTVLAAAAFFAYQTNEDRLLEQRTREAAAVLRSAVPTVETPVASAAELLVATGAEEGPFRAFMGPIVGEDRRFSSASIWLSDDLARGPIVVLGEQPVLASRPLEAISAFFSRQVQEPSLTVIDLIDPPGPPRLGYSYVYPDASPQHVVYVEQALPDDPTTVRQPDAAFAELDYALYIDGNVETGDLVFGSTSDLPLSGRTDQAELAIGDTELLLVMSPVSNLGGDLLRYLPWLILATGSAVAAGFAMLQERVLRRRDHAEELVAELARVADDNARLYGEQRSVSQTLQRSLLPESLPLVDGVELSARYESGVDEIDIGGDWYDVFPRDDERVLLVVGDVSGRGVRAASVMAGLRSSIRAYASQGDAPATILTRLGELLSVARDGHFATVVAAELDARTGSLSVASAGHPNLVLRNGTGASFVEAPVGVPVGVSSRASYITATVTIPEGSTLLAFTDGLFERRGETVDVGLERLRATVEAAPPDLEGLLDEMVERLAGTAQDDAAILGLRWLTPTTTHPS